MSDTKGFLLFNIVSREILVLAVKKEEQRKGIGSSLLFKLRLFEKVFVVHEIETFSFYKKNGFINRVMLNNKQFLAMKAKV